MQRAINLNNLEEKMETPTEYKADIDKEKPYEVLGFIESKTEPNFLELTAATARAMIISGALDTGVIEQEEIIDQAIAFTDLLITKVQNYEQT
jgi:hypothetical protein